MRRPGFRLVWAGVAATLVVASALPFALESPSAGPVPPAAQTLVEHVVEIMMENHAFDNLFGAFPGVVGFPSNVSLPNGSGGYVSPYRIDGASTADPPHDRASEIADLDNGTMDGFVEEMAKVNASAAATPMGYYNATEVGGYWALAKEFVLCDMYFQSVLGPTVPNRLYAIAGSSAGLTSNTYPTDGVRLYTIFDQLSAAGVSWKYYYAPGESGEGPPVPLEVSPLRDTPSEAVNVVPLSGLVPTIEAGALPAVTFVDPSGSDTYSEHPPQNITVGEEWSLSIIEAIEASSLWNSTAVFLTWDEGGGFYDSLVPPVVDSLGDGFRVPMIVVSPFTEGGGIDSTTFDHTSVLKFIDQNWGLPYLNERVAETNSLALAFRFDRSAEPTPSPEQSPVNPLRNGFLGPGSAPGGRPALASTASSNLRLPRWSRAGPERRLHQEGAKRRAAS